MEIHLIWAQDNNGGIGKKGELPWYIPEDLKSILALLSELQAKTIAFSKSLKRNC